jgi:hypothetical protein
VAGASMASMEREDEANGRGAEGVDATSGDAPEALMVDAVLCKGESKSAALWANWARF